ncbi:MAG: winged helix DNA-binding domain-containing protein [Pseudonocardia sp.]|nr:winged helix DNA-binding domain-containing protein [Pseudonocardia sp.]
MARSVGAREATVFRMSRHGMVERASRRAKLANVVGLGLQDTTDLAAAQALALRRMDPQPSDLTQAVRAGDLLPTWGPRLAAILAPPDAEPLVTAALLQATGGDGVAALAHELAPYAVERLREDGPLTKAEVGKAIAPRVPDRAMQDCQRCGRRHPSETLVKMLVWTHRVRLDADLLTDRAGRWAPAARWRPRRHRKATDDQRAELVRSYLSRFAPSTPAAFADWAGIETSHAQTCWRLVEDELTPAPTTASAKAMALTEDLDALAAPPLPPRARLVPPYDPFLQLRDRETLVPDAAHRRALWRAVANPGLVLIDGQAAGTWRGRRTHDHLLVTVSPFQPITRQRLRDVDQDLETIAVAAGCETVEVNLE